MMDRNVFLLGTGHEYQHNSSLYMEVSSEAINKFKRYISKEHERHEFQAIGEEMSKHKLMKDKNSTVPEDVANELGIFHEYCDNTKEDEKKLKEHGWKETMCSKINVFSNTSESKEEFEKRDLENETIREIVWIEKIVTIDKWPLLFICGSDHVESFSSKLQTKGINVTLLNRDWVPSYT